VPTTIPSRIDSREIAPWKSRLIARITSRVRPARPTMATMVDTLAKEMPWTIGSRAPNGPRPMVCNTVARPLTNRPAVTSSARSVPESPAAPPTIRGGAITPPYMVRMCWVP
jgi:hypothetical protein